MLCKEPEEPIKAKQGKCCYSAAPVVLCLASSSSNQRHRRHSPSARGSSSQTLTVFPKDIPNPGWFDSYRDSVFKCIQGALIHNCMLTCFTCCRSYQMNACIFKVEPCFHLHSRSSHLLDHKLEYTWISSDFTVWPCTPFQIASDVLNLPVHRNANQRLWCCHSSIVPSIQQNIKYCDKALNTSVVVVHRSC